MFPGVSFAAMFAAVLLSGTEISAILVAVITVSGSVIASIGAQRSKTAVSVVEQLNSEVVRLTSRVRALEGADVDLATYRIGTIRLIGQIEDAGLEPVWRPSATEEGERK